MKRKMILGTDWWTDCDDAVAVRILARAAKRGEIELCGICINAAMEHSVASLDGFLHKEGLLDIPLGIDLAATDFGGAPSYQARLAAYAVRYTKNTDACDAVSLYRKILAEADAPIEILEIGFPQVLTALLESTGDEFSPKSGMELIRERVKHTWVMAGKWDKDGERENNFCRNARSRVAAEKLCRLWPVPITFLGWEIGYDVISGSRLRSGDVLRDVLVDHGSPNGRSSWDPMLVLLALTGDAHAAGYETVVGRASVDPESGGNYFTPDENGSHAYVVKARENDYYRDAIDRLIG